jgi:hypothetical protein
VNAVFILWLRQLKLLFRSRARMRHRRDPARDRRLAILEDRGVAVGGAAANAGEAPTGAAVPMADGPASHPNGALSLALGSDCNPAGGAVPGAMAEWPRKIDCGGLGKGAVNISCWHLTRV